MIETFVGETKVMQITIFGPPSDDQQIKELEKIQAGVWQRIPNGEMPSGRTKCGHSGTFRYDGERYQQMS